jgi:hypothetical protein
MSIIESLHRVLRFATLTGVSLALAQPVGAHHSYIMFDGSTSKSVTGTVARLEWRNPHVFVWVYVRNSSAPGGHDLYAFENGSPGLLVRMGWSKDVLAVGETITVEYWPLKDGRNGGHFVKATRSDGRTLPGVGGPGTGVTSPVITPGAK